MTIKAFVYYNYLVIDGNPLWQWFSIPLYNAADHDERLDEDMDSGSILTIRDTDERFADGSMYRIDVSDGETTRTSYFIGFDSVSKRKDGYFSHQIELVEPSRLLMGLPIDGRKISLTSKYKPTLKEVVDGLLLTAELLEGDNPLRVAHQRFFAAENALLTNTKSPEFHWAAGTLLWECLCDIGNVINCIPRLVINDEKTAFDTVIFERVNEVSAVYEL